jgi:hypothetical protein
MKSIYNYIPETNQVTRAYNVPGIVVTTYDTRNVISHDKCFILLYQYYLMHVHGSQYRCLL